MTDPRQRLQARAHSLSDLAGRVTQQRAIEGVEVVTLRIADIRRDGGTQARAQINLETVQEYADDMQRGDQFPPGVVFYDGQEYWLARGFTRVAAAELNGETTYDFEVRQGTRRDAVLFSVGENAEHGQRRTNEDKRRAVLTLLDDPEWSQMSSEKIADLCHVSAPFVEKLRPSLPTVGSQREQGKQTPEIRIGADGRPYNVTNIQKKAEKRRAAAERKAERARPPVQTFTPDDVDQTPTEDEPYQDVTPPMQPGSDVPGAGELWETLPPARTDGILPASSFTDSADGMARPAGLFAQDQPEAAPSTVKIARVMKFSREVILTVQDDALLDAFMQHYLKGNGYVRLNVEFLE